MPEKQVNRSLYLFFFVFFVFGLALLRLCLHFHLSRSPGFRSCIRCQIWPDVSKKHTANQNISTVRYKTITVPSSIKKTEICMTCAVWSTLSDVDVQDQAPIIIIPYSQGVLYKQMYLGRGCFQKGMHKVKVRLDEHLRPEKYYTTNSHHYHASL